MVGPIIMAILIIVTVLYCVSLLNYVIDEKYLRVKFGFLPLRKISIADIRNVKPGHKHMSESWTNTIYLPTIRKKAITVYRRTGGFKRVVLTPDNPSLFIDKIKNHPLFVQDDIQKPGPL